MKIGVVVFGLLGLAAMWAGYFMKQPVLAAVGMAMSAILVLYSFWPGRRKG